MRNPFPKATLVFASVLLLASCGENNGLNQRDKSIDGKRLTKINILNVNKIYENNILKFTEGSYIVNDYNWSGNEMTGFQDGGCDFVYNNGNLAEVRFPNETYELSYNNGHVTEIRHSDSYLGIGYNLQFNYSDDGHFKTATRTSSIGTVSNYVFTWEGDNLVTVQEYLDEKLHSSTNYTYDTKHSQYSSFSEALKCILGEFHWHSANNVTNCNVQFFDGSGYTYSCAYTYEGDYPVKCVTQEVNQREPSAFEQTTYFEYIDGTGKSLMPQMGYIQISANNSSYGKVFGEGEYAVGTNAVLFAEPISDSYSFQSWSDGDTSNPRTITVSGNASYEAIFSACGR